MNNKLYTFLIASMIGCMNLQAQNEPWQNAQINEKGIVRTVENGKITDATIRNIP